MVSSAHSGSHSGLGHWKWQRVSALLLVPLSLWLMFSFFKALQLDYFAARSWLAVGWHAVLLTAWLLVAGYHAALGVQVVIEDYVSDVKSRRTWIRVVKTFITLACLGGLFAIIKLGFFAS